MPRPRKSAKFADLLSPLSSADLKQLKVEVSAEIRIRERNIQKEKQEETARKLRDKLRIGQDITFEKRGGGTSSAEVVGIFSDKVQIILDGRKSSIALTRISAIG